jgi:hypothetical protein
MFVDIFFIYFFRYVRALPKGKKGKRYNKHLILIRLHLNMTLVGDLLDLFLYTTLNTECEVYFTIWWFFIQ